jgi:hypothetical protein
MECLSNLLINTVLDIVNQIKSQISSSLVHLSSGFAGIRTPGLDRHIVQKTKDPLEDTLNVEEKP